MIVNLDNHRLVLGKPCTLPTQAKLPYVVQTLLSVTYSGYVRGVSARAVWHLGTRAGKQFRQATRDESPATAHLSSAREAPECEPQAMYLTLALRGNRV